MPAVAERVVKACTEEGCELLEAIRRDEKRPTEVYDALKIAVFDGRIMLADLYFLYGSMSNEFESFLKRYEAISGDNRIALDLEAISADELHGERFDLDDLHFYLRCKNCFGDFHRLLVQIERCLWFGTFSILEMEYGPTWIAVVDKNKRRQWAQVREDFRTNQHEPPLHEFSSLPDLRDLIMSSKNWSKFSSRLPKKLAEKKAFKDVFDHFLIPCRNKISHPTRAVAITYTEYRELKNLANTLSLDRWRGLPWCNLPLLSGEPPSPQWY